MVVTALVRNHIVAQPPLIKRCKSLWMVRTLWWWWECQKYYCCSEEILHAHHNITNCMRYNYLYDMCALRPNRSWIAPPNKLASYTLLVTYVIPSASSLLAKGSSTILFIASLSCMQCCMHSMVLLCLVLNKPISCLLDSAQQPLARHTYLESSGDIGYIAETKWATRECMHVVTVITN